MVEVYLDIDFSDAIPLTSNVYFIDQMAEVESMLEKGAIRKTSHCQGQILSNIFLSEKKEGTFRPIIDLKKVNSFIPYQKFKMESLKNIRSLLQPGDFLVK